MNPLNFSLTQKIIIDPCTHIQVELGTSIPKKMVGEVLCRVVAVATSVFAAIDLFFHLAQGIREYARLGLHKFKLIKPIPQETLTHAKTHMQHAKRFLGITLVGSLAGAVWPGVFKHFQPKPSLLEVAEAIAEEVDNDQDTYPNKPLTDSDHTVINQLAKDVHDGTEIAPYPKLEAFFKGASLQEKSLFVQVFSTDRSPEFVNVRINLQEHIYRPVSPDHDGRYRWLSNKQISDTIKKAHPTSAASVNNISVFCQAFYFHATHTVDNVKSILSSGRIEVMHKGSYKGAFVSLQPEDGYGSYVFALRRNIERLSPLENGFHASSDKYVEKKNIKSYWAGFSQAIPINKQTLAYIILRNNGVYAKEQEVQRAALENTCQNLTGRKISVLLEKDAIPYLMFMTQMGMGIPIEWSKVQH